MGKGTLNNQLTGVASGRVKRVVLYLRVSSKRQMDTDSDVDPDGNSIDTQRKWGRAFAKQLGAVIVREFVEPGNSAQTIEKRPEFRKMLAFLEDDGDIDAVIYYNRARVFRNYLDAGNTKQQLAGMGVQLLSARENFGEGLTAEVMEALTDVFNWWMVRQSGEDIKSKMANKARNGGTIGKAPIGYLNVRKRLDGREIRTVALDPERSHYIPMAFELMATGQETLETLQGKLTNAGLRMAQTGKGISIERLRNMLRDRYYLGFVEHEGIWYPGRHKALIEPELFDRVQRVMDANGENHVRHRTHNHYLKGAVWCGRCSARFVFQRAEGRHGGEYHYFFCVGRRNGCDMPYIPVEVMEEAVERHYDVAVSFSADFRAALLLDVDAAMDNDTSLSESLRDEYTKRLATLDRKEDYYLDLAAEEGWPKDKLRTKIDSIRDEREQITTALEASGKELAQGRGVLADALALLEQPAQLYRGGGDTVRALLNRALFSRLYVDGDKITNQEVREPFAALMEAHREHHAEQVSQQSSSAAHPKTYGATNKITSLNTTPGGHVSNKTRYVDLARTYSNRSDLAKSLARTLAQLRAAVETDPPASPKRATAPAKPSHKLSDRLDAQAVANLVAAFRSGTSKRALAEEFGISESSVKRLLRQHRTETAASA